MSAPSAPATPSRMPPAGATCRICGGVAAHRRYLLREMMFGTREAFEYVRCEACGTLQIETVPDDMARHYPAGYYSFSGADPVPLIGAMRRRLVRARVRPLLFGRRTRFRRLGRVIDQRVAVPPVFDEIIRPIASRAHLTGFDDPILDVGCGSRPARLVAFRAVGFDHVLGVDPFIARDVVYRGIRVGRRRFTEVEGAFGLVMFHHSFEHVADPDATMAHVARVLRPGGSLLIRTPVMGSVLWDQYGTDWVELDAPRHLHLFTQDSLATLAARHGLDAAGVVPDSHEWEFIGSEQYRSDLGMFEPGSWFVDPAASAWTDEQVRAFEVVARRINREGRSGRAGFWFRRP